MRFQKNLFNNKFILARVPQFPVTRANMLEFKFASSLGGTCKYKREKEAE